MIKMNQGGTALAADLNELKKNVGESLPHGFQEFVKEHDGAEPETNIFRINDENDSGVNRFIPVKKILEERNQIENLAPNTIPIAWAEGGNFVLLVVDTCEVQFWDHENGDITTLTNSFEDFMSMLQPFNVNDIQLKPGQVKSVWINPDFLKRLGRE